MSMLGTSLTENPPNLANLNAVITHGENRWTGAETAIQNTSYLYKEYHSQTKDWPLCCTHMLDLGCSEPTGNQWCAPQGNWQLQRGAKNPIHIKKYDITHLTMRNKALVITTQCRTANVSPSHGWKKAGWDSDRQSVLLLRFWTPWSLTENTMIRSWDRQRNENASSEGELETNEANRKHSISKRIQQQRNEKITWTPAVLKVSLTVGRRQTRRGKVSLHSTHQHGNVAISVNVKTSALCQANILRNIQLDCGWINKHGQKKRMISSKLEYWGKRQYGHPIIQQEQEGFWKVASLPGYTWAQWRDFGWNSWNFANLNAAITHGDNQWTGAETANNKQVLFQDSSLIYWKKNLTMG